MSARSFVLLVVLAAICAEFHLTSAFQWVKDPGTDIKQTYPDKKTLTLTWEWRLSGSEKVIQARIARYKTTDKDNTKIYIGSIYPTGSPSIDGNYFRLQSGIVGTVGVSNGKIEFIINDINNQGNNGLPENSKVLVDKFNYTYECHVTIRDAPNDETKSTKLIVYIKPTITTAPADEYVDGTNTNVILKCIADGKPKPNISWDIRRPSGISTSKEEELIIRKLPDKKFNKDSDVGIYTCTAKNNAGEVKASAVVQYTECYTGCSADDKIAIEMTQLTFNSDYENPSTDIYKELKDAIEKECLKQYFNSKDHTIYSCVVTSFRKGSVVANIKITYPTNTTEPRKPLQTAVETGTFAGQRVKTSFVSPTSPRPMADTEVPSAPTQPTPATDKSTDKPSDSPDSGKRTNSSLSKGAIIAIVVVFSIIFIVIIVVLIVCMLKRRKPAGSPSKPYQEDGKGRTAASAPLKSQPYIDPLYDNKPKDVVYADLNFQDRHTNGGGPPPQYTPSSNYAEVRPSQAEQNESGVEWDKSVRDEMWI